MNIKLFIQKLALNKRLFLVIIDLFICNTSIFISMYLRLGFFYPINDMSFTFLFLSSISLIIILIIFDIYKTINRFSGWDAFLQLGKALIIYDILFFTIYTLFGIIEIPRTIGLIHPIILTLMIILSRIIIRIILGIKFNLRDKNIIKEKVLIYGAGEAGRQLANTILYSKKMIFLGFIDDNKKLIGHKVNNKIIYDSKNLKTIKDKLKIDTILLAIPSLSNERKSLLLEKIQMNHIAVKTLPLLSELESKNISFNDIRPINVDELLGREKINVAVKIKENYIQKKIVLITGAGGSIGSELCFQVLEQQPSKLIILDSSEYNLYKINQELYNKLNKKLKTIVNIIPILTSIQNEKSITHVFKTYKPDIIFHAAAYKHVPLVQANPIEGILNNVLGTQIMAKQALKHHSKKFVLISSDKAVRPTNIMGASKRLAELYLQALNVTSKNTVFTIVRFGNVLGSSGSVIPKFQEQIYEGGPITLTHKKVTRFFMTAKEAIHLILQAGGMANGGEVFVLKMGEPVEILNLAKRMIFLSGKTIKSQENPKGDIEIKITGLRPGEKLYEEVLINNNPIQTENNMILKANEKFLDKKIISKHLVELKVLLTSYNIEGIDKILKKIIAGYKNKDLKY